MINIVSKDQNEILIFENNNEEKKRGIKPNTYTRQQQKIKQIALPFDSSTRNYDKFLTQKRIFYTLCSTFLFLFSFDFRKL